MNLARIVKPALAATLLAAGPAAAQSAGDEWRFTVAPYLWLPTIDSTVKLQTPNGTAEVSTKVKPENYLDDLDFALLIALEARKGKWLVATDYTFMNISTGGSTLKTVEFDLGPQGRIPVSAGVNTGTQTKLYTTIWTLLGGYNLVQEPKVLLDLIGGARYLKLESTTDWQLTASVSGGGPLGLGATFPAAGSATQKGDNWDAIVGVKGRARLGDGNWFVPYYLDAGTGDSKYTVQAQTGIGYGFGWGDLVLAYRYLAWKADDDMRPIQELKLYGFGFGGIFRF